MSVVTRVITSTSASGAQVIDGSLVLDGSSTYLTKTFATIGNRQKFTFSFWAKRAKYGATNMGIFSEYPGSGNGEFIRFSDDDSGDTFRFYSTELSDQSLVTKRKFRDAGWYHICVAVNTTESTDIDRVKIYINGDRNINSGSYVAWASSTWPDQYALYDWLNATAHYIGRCQSGSYFPGYLSQFYVIDGQALEPSEFAFTDTLTNTWRPKKFAGSYTTTSANNGTDWTSSAVSGVSGWTQALAQGFNGSLSNAAEGNTNGETATIALGQDITIAGGGVGVYTWVTSGQPLVFKLMLDGAVKETITQGSSGGKWYYSSSYAGDIDSITIARTSRAPEWGAISINGDILIDDVDGRGVNSFYLPFDGNRPIGEDQSGKGNDWTPVNFGGSNVIPKATGALPILNTVNGGNVRSAGVRTDAYASNLVFAAPLVGIATDVSNQINSTTTAKAITTNGDPAPDYDYSNFYGGSWALDGTGDFFHTVTSSDFAFGTGDFTIECWVYHTAAIDAGDGIFQISTGSGGYNGSDSNTLTLQTSGSKYMGYANDATADYLTPNIINKWTHLALVRKSSVTNLYVNGVKSSTNVSDSKNYTGTYLGIGIYYGTSYVWQGYMQDFRVYKGVAKYTSNFIPASPTPNIVPDTPSGVALGSPLDSISGITTEGAVHFDGSGDYISAGASADYALGTGDFTIEMWVNIPKNPRSIHNTLFATRGAAGITTGFNIGIFEDPSNRHLYMYSNGQRLTYSTKVPDGWNHIAVTRESNALKSFINGALEGTGTTTQDYTNNTVSIGAVNGGGAENTSGYISNFRLIKGTARYTAPFNPPTEPLTSVTNTKLLCCQSPDFAGAAAVSPHVTGSINDGTVWSEESSITPPASGFNSGGEIILAFDGYTSTLCSGAGSRSEFFVINFAKSISVSSSLEVYMSSGASEFKVNDGSYGVQDSGAWRSLSFTGTLTSLSVKGDESQVYGNFAPRLSAIRIDGSTILTDPVTVYKDTISSKFNPFMPEDINTVMGQETGYATLDPIGSSSDVTLSNGNLDATTGTTDSRRSDGTIQMKTGKWYIEWFIKSIADAGSSGYPQVGIVSDIASGQYNTGTYWPGGTGSFGVGYDNDGDTIIDWGSGNGSYGQAFVAGDTIGMAVDADRGAVYFSNNGRWQDGATSKGISNGSSRSDAALTWSGGKVSHFPAVAVYNGAAISANFGQKPFKFIPPEDFLPLNFANLPSIEVATPSKYVGVTTYNGSGSAQVISGIGFQPDLIWTKNRNSSYDQNWVDSVRGSTSFLSSSENVAAFGSYGYITPNHDGYAADAPYSRYNHAGEIFVTWCWKAGGNKNTFNVDGVGHASAAAAGLTGGDITPTGASVGTRQGFSIITWDVASLTGTKSVDTGLTQAPEFVITKVGDAADDWLTFHKDLTSTETLILNGGRAKLANAAYAHTFNSDGTISDMPVAGSNWWIANKWYVFYSWHSVPGLQKFGIYEGNNSTDGPYVELGFRPVVIMIKNIDATADWVMYDNVRDPLNVGYRSLYPNDDAAENTTATVNEIDFLSNGFKLRNDDIGSNDANTYIYAAWAHQPMNNLYGAESNGR